MVGNSRRRRVAGAGALVVALGCVLTLAPNAGATRATGLAPGWRVQTRRACGAVVGLRVRCSAIEVLDAATVTASSPGHGQPARRRPPRTTTTSTTTTTSPTT